MSYNDSPRLVRDERKNQACDQSVTVTSEETKCGNSADGDVDRKTRPHNCLRKPPGIVKRTYGELNGVLFCTYVYPLAAYPEALPRLYYSASELLKAQCFWQSTVADSLRILRVSLAGSQIPGGRGPGISMNCQRVPYRTAVPTSSGV